MSGAPPGGREGHRTAPRTGIAMWMHLVRQRIHERAFWIVQALVLGVTAIHIGIEAGHLGERLSLGGLVELPVVLHLIPVVYAGFRYGYEGSVLTGIWSGVLAIPNIVLWHSEGYGWLGDLTFIVFVIVLGAVIAVPVERERHQRHRAETFARKVIRAQERERSRIARDLHDVVAQELVLLTRQLDDLAGEGDGAGTAGPRERASEVLDTVRRVSRGLRPSTLEDLGLVPAVRDLVDDLGERSDVAAVLEVDRELPSLPEDLELTLYRIVQEALHNTERHADADHVTVAVTTEDDVVDITVADDGRGFHDDGTVISGERGLGLLGMHERAQLAGGSLEITAAPGEGTTITVRIPVSRSP